MVLPQPREPCGLQRPVHATGTERRQELKNTKYHHVNVQIAAHLLKPINGNGKLHLVEVQALTGGCLRLLGLQSNWLDPKTA